MRGGLLPGPLACSDGGVLPLLRGVAIGDGFTKASFAYPDLTAVRCAAQRFLESHSCVTVPTVGANLFSGRTPHTPELPPPPNSRRLPRSPQRLATACLRPVSVPLPVLGVSRECVKQLARRFQSAAAGCQRVSHSGGRGPFCRPAVFVPRWRWVSGRPAVHTLLLLSPSLGRGPAGPAVTRVDPLRSCRPLCSVARSASSPAQLEGSDFSTSSSTQRPLSYLKVLCWASPPPPRSTSPHSCLTGARLSGLWSLTSSLHTRPGGRRRPQPQGRARASGWS